jgi:GH15 family glucan-1,4-alpha-glucosidase
VASRDRYPLIGDYGLIGDCHTAALVSREGSIDWCCLPRFDSGSAFARLLDWERGGHCSIDPTGRGSWSCSREYLDATLVLSTTIDGPSGAVRVLDCFTVADRVSAQSERRLLRVIEGVRGTVDLELRVAPRFDYGGVRPWIRRHGERLHSAIGGNDAVVVWCEAELAEDQAHELAARISIADGDRIRLTLTYCAPETIDARPPAEPDAQAIDRALEETIRWWRKWARSLRPEGRDEPAVRRSGIALKALTYAPTGAIVAAPTTSLPEAVGGPRNWDYRYAWVRDASFSSRSFAELGATREADAFRAFIVRSAAGHAGDLQVLYGVGGERRLGGTSLEALEGYRGSAPVRIGNDARSQRQFDAYGEIVNLMWRWHRRGHSPSDDDWRFLVSLIDHAAERWAEPDQGLWEWPGDPDHFVHSKVLCWAALDRGIRLADECMRRAPVRRWRQERDKLRRTIERRGYDRERGVFVQAFDRDDLDAALLLLPTVEFVDWDDERMLRTVAAVREDLDAGDGLLFRYRREDGLEGREGAFLCCSFWLAECLARGGDPGEARAVFDRASACANDLGLLSEEVDPTTGQLLGNFPQALTHLAQIDAAVALEETRTELSPL